MMQGDSAEDERMIQWALEVTNLTEYRDREVFKTFRWTASACMDYNGSLSGNKDSVS